MNSKPTGWASDETEAGSKAALAKDDAAWKAMQESHFANHGSSVQWKCFTGQVTKPGTVWDIDGEEAPHDHRTIEDPNIKTADPPPAEPSAITPHGSTK